MVIGDWGLGIGDWGLGGNGIQTIVRTEGQDPNNDR